MSIQNNSCNNKLFNFCMVYSSKNKAKHIIISNKI